MKHILAFLLCVAAVAQSVPPGGGKPLRVSVDDSTYYAAPKIYLVPGTGVSYAISCANGKCSVTINASAGGISTGTSLPATCAVGDLYLKTDASPNTALWYACTATNTWTQQVGSGGSSTSYVTFPAANCQLGAASTGFVLPSTLYPTATCISGSNVITAALSFSNNGASAAGWNVATR